MWGERNACHHLPTDLSGYPRDYCLEYLSSMRFMWCLRVLFLAIKSLAYLLQSLRENSVYLSPQAGLYPQLYLKIRITNYIVDFCFHNITDMWWKWDHISLRRMELHSYAVDCKILHNGNHACMCYSLTVLFVLRVCIRWVVILSMYCAIIILYWLISPGTKWLLFRRWYLQMHFPEWNLLYWDQNFTEVCS